MRIATTRGGDATRVLTPEQRAQQIETLRRAMQVAAKKGAALTSDDLKSVTPAPIMVTPDAVPSETDFARADDAANESFFQQYKTPLIIGGLLLSGIIFYYFTTKRKK